MSDDAPLDCRHCGHPRGVHHAGSSDEQLCAVKGCDCYGFAPPLAEGDGSA